MSAVLVQMWRGASPVPVQMWAGRDVGGPSRVSVQMWQGHLGDHKVKDGEEVVGAEMQVGAAVGDAERLHPPMERPPIQKVSFPLEHNKANRCDCSTAMRVIVGQRFRQRVL